MVFFAALAVASQRGSAASASPSHRGPSAPDSYSGSSGCPDPERIGEGPAATRAWRSTWPAVKPPSHALFIDENFMRGKLSGGSLLHLDHGMLIVDIPNRQHGAARR